MKISVVIPALDEAEGIAGAIESAAQTAGPEGEVEVAVQVEVEVWVVDGGSRDDTRERARRAGAAVLRSAPGRARQLQAGFEASRGEVVLFLHADTRLPRGWGEAVRDALRDPKLCGGAFRFAFDESGGWGLHLVEWGARLRAGVLGLPYGDQALFARRSVLERIGGVPQAPLMEDLDLVRAMKKLGRIAVLGLPVRTSPRRYLAQGILRTMLRNWLALCAWRAGVDRARVAAWVGR